MSEFDVNERGQAILDIFKERQGGGYPAALADAEEKLSTTTKPGGGKVPQHFDVGNFGHQYAERLVPSLPKGLDKEVAIDLPDGSKKRLDRVDWDKRIVYEVKPDTPGSKAAGEKQAKLYADLMNERYGKPEKKWTYKVVTYDQKAVTRLLKDIGWIKVKPSQAKKSGKNPLRKAFTGGALATALNAASPAPAEAAKAPNPAMTSNTGTFDTGTNPVQRMTDTPDKVTKAPAATPATDIKAKAIGTAPVSSPPITAKPTGSKYMPQEKTPPIQKKGTITVGKVTIDFDLTTKDSKKSFRLKALDISDFFKEQSKLTSSGGSPILRQFSTMTASSLANYLSGWALEKIRAHFASIILEAEKKFNQLYPESKQLWNDFQLEPLEETFYAIVNEKGQWWLKDDAKTVVRKLEGAFEYEEALINLHQKLTKDFQTDFNEMHTDIRRRGDVLTRIGNNIEEAFIKIHTSLIGSVPVVYYQSFDLWNVRGVFIDLGTRMSGLSGLIASRRLEYEETSQKIHAKLLKISPKIEEWREYYEEHKHLNR